MSRLVGLATFSGWSFDTFGLYSFIKLRQISTSSFAFPYRGNVYLPEWGRDSVPWQTTAYQPHRLIWITRKANTS